MDQRAAEPQLLLHAAGKFHRGAVGEGLEAGTFQQLGNARLPLPAALSEQPAEEIDILEDGQGGIKVLAETLRHIGDTRAGILAVARIGHIAAQNLHLAFLDGARAGDERQQARFAHTVRPDKPDHPPGGDLDRYVGQRNGASEGQPHIGQSRDRCMPVIRCGRRDHGGHRHLTRLRSRFSGQAACGSSRT